MFTPLEQEVFDDNWEFQEPLFPQVKQILIQQFNLDTKNGDTIKGSSRKIDMELGIDLIINKKDPCETQFHIGVRIRNIDYYENYKEEFTVRYPSEMKKIRNGYIHYDLYCFATKDEILRWTLIDLYTFSEAIDKNEKLITDNILHKNTGGNNTDFYAFNYANFPKHMIISLNEDQSKIQSATIKIKKETKNHLLEFYNSMNNTCTT